MKQIFEDPRPSRATGNDARKLVFTYLSRSFIFHKQTQLFLMVFCFLPILLQYNHINCNINNNFPGTNAMLQRTNEKM